MKKKINEKINISNLNDNVIKKFFIEEEVSKNLDIHREIFITKNPINLDKVIEIKNIYKSFHSGRKENKVLKKCEF